MGSGKRCIAVGYAGAIAGCGSGYGTLCSKKPTTRAKWSGKSISSTARLCALTNTLRGQKSTPETEALGRSRGGLTTKVHARVDGNGRPFTFALTPGQQHDATLAECDAGGEVDAARSDLLRQAWSSAPSTPEVGGGQSLRVAPVQAAFAATRYPTRHSTKAEPETWSFAQRDVVSGAQYRGTYRERNIVERFFCRLKHFRAVATRYDKRATTYMATVLLASIVLCL